MFQPRQEAGFNGAKVRKIVEALYRRAVVLPLTRESMLLAAGLRDRHQLSFWDSHLVACALIGGCASLESEDMQDGLVVDGVLTISNPFKP
jgi:predicted nucleic acid-binding protein